jgi:hypothetical protein
VNLGTCIHWNGLRGDDTRCCDAGVNYHKAFNGEKPGMFLRMPCRVFDERPAHGRGTYIKAGEPVIRKEIDRRGEAVIPCALYVEPTPEQVQAHRVRTDAYMERTMAAITVASAWRVKPKPAKDRAEVIECPACKGRLHLSQSAYNGHVHGQCETTDCVSWME